MRKMKRQKTTPVFCTGRVFGVRIKKPHEQVGELANKPLERRAEGFDVNQDNQP